MRALNIFDRNNQQYNEINSPALPKGYLSRMRLLVSLGLCAIATGCETQKPIPAEWLRPTPLAAFTAGDFEDAPKVLGMALRALDNAREIRGEHFRIEMCKFPGSWHFYFSYQPAKPDIWGEVNVYDDGRVEVVRW